MEEKILGRFGVDSGQVLIVDPCYLDRWKGGEFAPDTAGRINDYDEACKVTTKRAGGEHSIGGVVSCTGYGDGQYTVTAKIENDRVKELVIRFF